MKALVLMGALMALVSCSTMDAVRLIAAAARPSAEPAAPDTPEPPQARPEPRAAEPSEREGLDPAAQAEWNKAASAVVSKRSFPAGSDLSSPTGARTFKGGEWVVYRNLDGAKMTGLLKMALVRQDGDAWVFELTSMTDTGSTVIQEAIQGLGDLVSTGNPEAGKVLWVKVRGRDGKIETLQGAMLGMMGNTYKAMITANSGRSTEALTPGGPVTVPAGTFAATWKATSQLSQGRSSEKGTVWLSTQVPVWHLIKAQGTSGRVLELVDFGASGYVSAFP